MFSGCTSLTQAPELPATTLAEGCYHYMFEDCESLAQAPELSATTLAWGCYRNMFSGCTSLSEISVAFNEWNDNTSWWVANVAPTGTFICPKELPLEFGFSRIPIGWTVKNIIDGDTVDVPVNYNYLTFTAEEDSSSFGLVNKNNSPDVWYSLDGGKSWNALEDSALVMLAHKGDTALLRGYNTNGLSRSLQSYSYFTMAGKMAASGSVMSLIDGMGLSTEIPRIYCFYNLFSGCEGLTQSPELPATILTQLCYYRMFSGCTSLTQVPSLPATTLDYSCYESMFSGCTSLTQAPKLPATTLAGTCYCEMFLGCTSLAQAPALSATTLADRCYRSMFEGCASLTQAPALPATTLADGCYESMFSDCTSLTQAPALPATILDGGCYRRMFSGCTSLTQVPALPATTLDFECYRLMFSKCASLAQAPALPATTLANNCYYSMFSGCTSLTQAPELPATTLAYRCYYGMFSGCTSLSEISVSFEDWQDDDFRTAPTSGWLSDVAPTGTFICPKELPLEYRESRIPKGWTVKYIEEGGSGVSSALAEGVTVWTDDLTVYVCGAEGEVSLYDMSGRRIAVSNSADEERALSVPAKGVYVVRTSGGERSVLVR